MKLDACGCCKLPISTPLVAANRPGLSAIVFRVGTYSSFRSSMLQRIAAAPGLSALQTRSDDDYAITLLDMWATIGDVLTFYQERIANEGFLRTARRRDSILRMARMLDYQLRPGVAANSLLAFTLDKDTTLQIPKGLRVQSVPADDEKPQIFETLESIVANAGLNRVRILPAPEGFNPLTKGNTTAILAPGEAGLLAAAALSGGDHFVVFEPGPSEIEELQVSDVRAEEERVVLSWTSPIQGANWSLASAAFGFNRKFRIFGCNAPTTYMEAREDPSNSGTFLWSQRTFTSFSYTSPAPNVIELDTKYEGITVGSQLLIFHPNNSGSGRCDLVTVTAVGQGPAKFTGAGGDANRTPVQDTVTRVTVAPALPVIDDRRSAVIYEITSPPIQFWGYRYPDVLASPRAFIPARRISTQTAEIGRAVENNAYTEGTKLSLTSIGAGRPVMLLDENQVAVPAVVTGRSLVGLDVVITPTPSDSATAQDLKLDAAQARAYSGLRSAALPNSFVLTGSSPELSVKIGSLAARRIRLSSSPTTIDSAVAAIRAALTASHPAARAFTQSRVVRDGKSIVVFPGVRNTPISISDTPNDRTTAGELGFASSEAIRVDALLSGNLPSIPALSNPLRQLAVSFGPIGPRRVSIDPGATNRDQIGSYLQSALINADPAPAFALARVFVTNNRLLVLPGTGGAPIQEYLTLGLRAESSFRLALNSAALLGNIALASHGEKVTDEVLGDGDASTTFQKFELQKKPLTYISSADPGGVATSLGVSVNDVAWSEVPTLFGKGPADQVFTTRLADDGTVTVGFGDGVSGARVPSGRGNVVADYRQGSGLAGRVPARSLRTPLDLPVGLRSVTNPAAATGGADPELLEQARENAPTTVRTFGRVVSLRDFEDMVRSSGEVAKALATWVWNGETRVVHLTIAAQQGLAFSAADLARIHASLDTQRDPNHILFLDNYVEVRIAVTATVRVKSNRVASIVSAAARAALRASLSFDQLRFGQTIDLSEAYATLQAVDGVESVDIDRFHFRSQGAAFLAGRGATTDAVQRRLPIFPARPNPALTPPVLPAELAVLEAADARINTSGGLPD